MVKQKWRDRAWLKEHYVDQGLSLDGVAALADCGAETIRTWACRFGLLRSPSEAQTLYQARVRENMVGQRFGRLVVVGYAGAKYEGKKRCHAWRCICDCGNVIVTTGQLLRGGQSKSCGCARNEQMARLGRQRALEEGEAAGNSLYSKYKGNAKRKGRLFELSRERFKSLTKGRCYYCGVPPLQVYGHHDCVGEYVYNGIDRVDNDLGYVEDNMVSCCKWCNRAKRDQTEREFLAWAKRVYKYRIEGREVQ